MTFRNPWIDPRVAQVSPEGVRDYLERSGWKFVGPATNPALSRYEVADGDESAPTLFVPVQGDQGPALQWMIELVGDLASWQGRYAGDVLTDILRGRADQAPNGAVQGSPQTAGR
jgi:hypothetical protein